MRVTIYSKDGAQTASRVRDFDTLDIRDVDAVEYQKSGHYTLGLGAGSGHKRVVYINEANVVAVVLEREDAKPEQGA